MFRKIVFFALFSIFFFFLGQEKILAAGFSLAPQTKFLKPGEKMTVVVKIDTEGEKVIGAGAVLSYNPEFLKLVKVDGGSFFSTFNFKADKAYVRVAGTIGFSGVRKSGRGPLATLNFEAKKPGISGLNFNCGTPAGSSINKQDPHNPSRAVNIVNCQSLVDGSYRILDPTISPPDSSPAPGAGGGGAAACDLCGFCQGGKKPPDWDKCVACLYKDPGPPPKGFHEGNSWTVIGCFSTKPTAFIQKVLRFIIAVSGGLFFLVFLFAGFNILTSRGSSTELFRAKKLLVSSLLALLLVIFSVFMLKFIGVRILKIPGFGGG